MLLKNLFEIVDLNFDKRYKNIGIYGHNITTKALQIFNEFDDHSIHSRESGSRRNFFINK